MHQRKSCKISVGRRWFPRQYVQVGLRPSQAENAPQDAYQPVLNVRQLRTGGRADSVDHHERVRDVPCRSEVVGSTVDGVSEAIGQASGALAQQRIGDRSVIVVNNSYRSARGGRCNVRGSGDRSVGGGYDVAAVHVFGKMSALRCGDGDTGNAGPWNESGGNKNVGLCVREDRTQVSLVSEVLEGTIRPDQRMAFDSWIVAGARDESWASGAAGNGTANQKSSNHQNSRAHAHSSSLLALRMARSS